MGIESDLQEAFFQKSLSTIRAKTGHEVPIEPTGRISADATPEAQAAVSGAASSLGMGVIDQRIKFAQERGVEQASIIEAYHAKAERDKLAREKEQRRLGKERMELSGHYVGDGHNHGMDMPPTAKPFIGNYRLTQGDSHDHSKGTGAHAWDYGMPVNTPVAATMSGKVLAVKDLGNNSYGKYIVILGNDGKQYYFAHLNGFNVQPGQQVKTGQTIGLSGNSGKSSGAHLHYEIRG